MKPPKADLCVIGIGSAGLSATAFTAQWGVKVVLVERSLFTQETDQVLH